MKKEVLVILILIIFLSGCAQYKEIKKDKSLSELQVLACNTADEQNTCNSRLREIGIVTKEDCCILVGKCC